MNALLIDLDGVIYEGERAVAGAPKAISLLAERGVPHLFVTNTTSRPRHAIVDKLAGLGISTTEKQKFTPPVAASIWLKDHAVSRVALFVPEMTATEFDQFDCLDPEAEAGAQAVVIGDLGDGWSFNVLNRAFRLMMQDPQPHLIALGMTRYWLAPDGLRLDTAPFVMALVHATGAQPLVLGKPAKEFFESALTQLNSAASTTCMIGDDIQTDVGGAQAAGLRGILVRTGKFRPTDMDSDIQPNAVLASFAALPDWLQEQDCRSES